MGGRVEKDLAKEIDALKEQQERIVARKSTMAGSNSSDGRGKSTVNTVGALRKSKFPSRLTVATSNNDNGKMSSAGGGGNSQSHSQSHSSAVSTTNTAGDSNSTVIS